MKRLSIDAFTLKIIAIISMGVHHTLMVFWEVFPMWLHVPLYLTRGVTFPIMAFFATEGFRRTSSIKRYMLRLLIFGALAQFPYMMALGMQTLNIIFTIMIGLASIELYERLYINAQRRGLFVFLYAIILITSLFVVEGGFFGPLLILLFHVIKDERKRRTYPLIFWGAVMVLSNIATRVMLNTDTEASLDGIVQLEAQMANYYVFAIGTFFIIPLLRAYNGNRGRKAKFLFYAFYPLHFAVLALVSWAV